MVMGLTADITAIKAMQDAYFALYGDYFETDNKKKIKIPTIGGDAKIKKFTKFKPNKDKAPQVTETDFIPTAKDYRFTIGQMVYVNNEEGGYEANKEKRAYVITAERKNVLGTQVERSSFWGGDQWVIDVFTEGDKSETIPYVPELD
jgi:hypothetical protein